MKVQFSVSLPKARVEIWDHHGKLQESVNSKSGCFTLSLCEGIYIILVRQELKGLFGFFKIRDDIYQTQKITVNEQTTVAGIFTLCQLLTPQFGLIATERQIKLALLQKNNFIFDDGQISEVIKNSPNGLETNSYPLFNFLSNLVFYSLTQESVLEQLLSLTGSTHLLEAVYYLALFPFRNVTEIYHLIDIEPQIYQPSLPDLVLPPHVSGPIPNQWTLTVKINNSGAQNFIIGGPGYIAFDNKDRAWIANNVTQGTAGSSAFGVILNSDGSPSKLSPIFGGGIQGCGFGVAANKRGDRIAFGNFGWGPVQYNPQTGGVSIFDTKGRALSSQNGFTRDLARVQGLYYDSEDNLWMTSWGSQEPLGGGANDSIYDFESQKSAITVYIKGNPRKSVTYQFSNEHFGTFDVIVNSKGEAYVTNSGSQKHQVPSSVYKFRLLKEEKRLEVLAVWESKPSTSGSTATDGTTVSTESSALEGDCPFAAGQFEVFRQVALNSKEEVYVGTVTSSRVIKFDADLNPLKVFTNKIDSAWGINFDASDTMFVANFRRDTERVGNGILDMTGTFGVTMIKEDQDETAQIFTLPTGGDQVMLANNQPLYGNQGTSFTPLMRLTGTVTDAIGNVWAVNNWKPALLNDVESNPGGDGIVIFIGIAAAY